MTDNKISIKEADRRVFIASFDNGLVDIFISSVVLMFAIAPYLSVYLGDFWGTAIFLPFWGAVYLILLWIYKHVIKPRSGVVVYGSVRKKKLTLFTGIMFTLNVIFIILSSVAFFTPLTTGWTSIIPFATMVLISFSLAGYFLDVPRFYLYGMIICGGFFIGEWLYQVFAVPHHGYPIVFGISAGIIFLMGLFKLLTFVQVNPLPSDEQMQVEGKNG